MQLDATQCRRTHTTRRRWIISIVVVVFLAALGIWIGLLFNARSRALADYERVRSGQRPHSSVSEFALADGGSIGWECFGYTILRIKRFTPPRAVDEEMVFEYETGLRLTYTCRDWFPILHRFVLVDIEEIDPQPTAGPTVRFD